MSNDKLATERGAVKPNTGPDGGRRFSDHNREAEPQIGRALRSVYDQTVGEAIPKEMLELLGRLD